MKLFLQDFINLIISYVPHVQHIHPFLGFVGDLTVDPANQSFESSRCLQRADGFVGEERGRVFLESLAFVNEVVDLPRFQSETVDRLCLLPVHQAGFGKFWVENFWSPAGLLQDPDVPLIEETKHPRCLWLILSRDELQRLPYLGRHPKAYISYVRLPINFNLVNEVRIKSTEVIDEAIESSGAQRRGTEAHLPQHPSKQVVVLKAPASATAPHQLIKDNLNVHGDPLSAVDAEVFKRDRHDVQLVDQ